MGQRDAEFMVWRACGEGIWLLGGSCGRALMSGPEGHRYALGSVG